MDNLQTEFDTLPSLDQVVLGQLHEDMGEDVPEVLAAFLESIEDLLAELKNRSGDDSDDTNLRRAHSMKSSAASIGMMKLSAIAAHMEKALKHGESVDVDETVKQIEIEYQHSRHLLDS